MEIHKLRITEGKRIFLDDFEIKNVKAFEMKSPTESSAELIIKLDVIIGQVGFELKP